MALPMALLPFLSGFLVDFYSSQAGQPDYAPPFILFDGLMLITLVLVFATPSSLPSTGLEKINSMSTASLRSTPSLRLLRQQSNITLDNWLILGLILIPLTLWSGIQWGIMQTHLYPFYIEIGVDKTWLGIGFAVGFLTLLPFSLMGKKLVSGVGRLHLILLGFIFYSFRFTTISFLTLFPKWMLLPLESLSAFTLPLTWYGITSYAHFLIRTTLRPELMIRTGIDPSNDNHMRMQYFLNFLHFGLGRVIGSGLWMLWVLQWESYTSSSKQWEWLTIHDTGFPENDSHGFRILLRLMAIISALISIPILFFYHVMGRVLHCFRDIAIEIKQSIICVRDVFIKCFSLVCCCSCSCRIGKCRLCRRTRGDSEYDEEEEERKIEDEQEERDQKNHLPRDASFHRNSTPGGHPLTQVTPSSLNGTAGNSSRAQYARLLDQSVPGGVRPEINGQGIHRERHPSRTPFETELRSTGREVHQTLLKKPSNGVKREIKRPNAVKNITPGFVGLEHDNR